MPQSKDIVILDNDTNIDTTPSVISTNNSKLNFDDIFEESKTYTTKNVKPPKLPKPPKAPTKKQIQQYDDLQHVEEKQNMILIIQKYQSSEMFGTYIKKDLKVSYTEEQLNHKSVKQLHQILTKIRINLDNKNLSKMYDNVLFGATMMIETISKPIVNVDGFNQLLKENEQFASCWERVKCESVMPTIPSHLQMMLILGQTYFMAYAMNKVNNPSPEVQQIIADVEREVDEENKQRQQEKKLENENTKNENTNNIIIKPIIEEGMDI